MTLLCQVVVLRHIGYTKEENISGKEGFRYKGFHGLKLARALLPRVFPLIVLLVALAHNLLLARAIPNFIRNKINKIIFRSLKLFFWHQVYAQIFPFCQLVTIKIKRGTIWHVSMSA